MSKLTDSLLAAGEKHRGTDLGGLLQWAALHIGGQDFDNMFAFNGLLVIENYTI